MIRNFFLGFVKIHILHHAAAQPVYGQALMRELQRHGYEISPGTLYPILHNLESDGLLERHNKIVTGRQRKYYTATPHGLEALAEARERVQELVAEVLENNGPSDIESITDGD